MPQLGMLMVEGTLLRWLVEDGARVTCGEELLEIETEKVTQTIAAPAEGVVKQVAYPGQVVPVLGMLGYILAPGETVPETGQKPIQPERTDATSAPIVASPANIPSSEVRATPVARRLAAEHQLDLARIIGTGPGGRIVEADVLSAVQRASAAPRPPEPQTERRIPLTGRRGLIARRMMESLANSAQLSITREVDVGDLVKIRQLLLARAEELGVQVSYDAFLVKALARALAEQPVLNSTIDADTIVIADQVNVGVAIATESGLTVPVVRRADSRSLLEIAHQIADFADRTRRNALSQDDLAGGTVTITNIGPFGADFFTPILNSPQSAILGVGRIAPRPSVFSGALAIRPTCYLCLTWDHRVTDGAEAAQLLCRVVELIVDRYWLEGLLQ